MNDSDKPKLSLGKWLLFVTLMLGLLPLMLLVAAEISIRYLAPAPPASFFVKDKLPDGSEVYRANYMAATRFFPGLLARKPLPEVFRVKKNANDIRIFILGESAARGEFLADFSFARVLQAFLQKNNPDRRIEVINTGIPAINSWVIKEITEEIVNYEPDLVIIYAGHNEFIGPYGPASIFSANAGRIAAKIGIFASSLHLVRLLKGSSLPDEMSRGWRGLDMFSQNSIPAEDARIETCKNNWQKNLEEILTTLKQKTIKTIVCSVPVNIRDCPPFNSEPLPEEYNRILELLKNHFHQNEWQKLVEVYENNQEIFAQHALAQWLCGFARLKSDEKHVRDQSLFLQALESDTFRVRAMPAFNQIAKQTAEKQGIVFADVWDRFKRCADAWSPGNDLVYDHVHLTEKGHRLVAAEIYNEIVKSWSFNGLKLPKLHPDDIFDDNLLGFTDSDEIHHLGNVISAFNTAPFNRQFNNKQRIIDLEQELKKLQKRLDTAKDTHRVTAVLDAFPDNGYISLRLAQLYSQTGHQAEAQAYFKRSLESNPFNIDCLNNYGTLLFAAGDIESARNLFKKALQLAPNFADAHFNLALCASREKNIEPAKNHYLLALGIEPGFAAALRNLANLYFAEKNFKQAEYYYHRAFAADPTDIHAIIGAGNACLANNDPENAKKSFELARNQFPDRPEGDYSLGMLHEKFNQAEVAVPYFISALQRFKHKPSADRVFNLIAAGKLATSTSSLKQLALACCAASEYNDPWHLQLLAVTSAELGEKDRAISVLHQALELARARNETKLAADLEDSLRILVNN